MRNDRVGLALGLAGVDDALDVRAPADPEVDVALRGALDEGRVDGRDVRPGVEQDLLGLVEQRLVLGVDVGAHRGQRQRDVLRAALEEVDLLLRVLGQQVEALLQRLGRLLDDVGAPVPARDAVVLRHRVDVAGVVGRLREGRLQVLEVRQQLVIELEREVLVDHLRDGVAGRHDDVEARAAGAELGQQLLVRAVAVDLDLGPELARVALVRLRGRSSRPSWPAAAGRPRSWRRGRRSTTTCRPRRCCSIAAAGGDERRERAQGTALEHAPAAHHAARSGAERSRGPGC